MRNRYHFSNVNRNLENLLPILMRLTSVVLTSWISSITGKISWIVAWPWSNNVCLCVSVRLCLSVIDSTNWYMDRKNKYWNFVVWKFGFWPGEVMEKSWNFFLRFFWEPCKTSNISCTLVLSRQWNCQSLRCSWSIACRRCSNYIFLPDLTPGFNGLGKDNCKPRRETFEFRD